MNKNIGLVLEGGGFRGSYTAGALNWLADQGIFFNYTVTISAATPFAFLYLTNNIQQMHDISVNGLSDKNVFGIKPIFNEGSIVGYNFLINKYLRPFYKEALEKLRNSDKDMEVGLYNMTKQQLQYFNKSQFDDDVQMFKANCDFCGSTNAIYSYCTAEKNGDILVIRPKNIADVSRTEKDLVKLDRIYNEGYSYANEHFQNIADYLK